MLPFLLDEHLEVEWPDSMACVYKIRLYIRLVFKKLPKCFLKLVLPLIFFTTVYESSCSWLLLTFNPFWQSLPSNCDVSTTYIYCDILVGFLFIYHIAIYFLFVPLVLCSLFLYFCLLFIFLLIPLYLFCWHIRYNYLSLYLLL